MDVHAKVARESSLRAAFPALSPPKHFLTSLVAQFFTKSSRSCATKKKKGIVFLLSVPFHDRTSQLPAGPLRAVRVVEAERFGQARLPLILLNFLCPPACFATVFGSDQIGHFAIGHSASEVDSFVPLVSEPRSARRLNFCVLKSTETKKQNQLFPHRSEENCRLLVYFADLGKRLEMSL